MEFIFYSTNSSFLDVLEFSVLFSTFIPVRIYPNGDTDKIQILFDNKGKAGIYQWTHIESGKKYIGSAPQGAEPYPLPPQACGGVGSAFDLSKRLKNYYSTYYLKQANSYICYAITCHTHSVFSLSILEHIDISNLSKKRGTTINFRA